MNVFLDNLSLLIEKKLVGMRSLTLGILLGIIFLPFLLMFGIFRGIILVVSKIFSFGKKVGQIMLKNSKVQSYRRRQQQILREPKQNSRVIRLYRYMEEAE